MSFYLWITAVNEPAVIGVDDNQRSMFSMNFGACAREPVVRFEEEIAAVLAGAGYFSLGTTGFIGPNSTIPPDLGGGPFVTIINTGGTSPNETHDNGKCRVMSCQLVVRGLNSVTTRGRALAVWHALDGIRNTNITGI